MTCEACRALSADFYAIHDMALELGAEGIAPPERVWISLRNQLEAEGLIHGDLQAAPQPVITLAPAGGPFFSGPRLAGAFLGIVLAAASAVIGYLSNFPQTAVQSEADASAGDFFGALRGQRFQGRSADRGERFDSGAAKTGHCGDRFHSAEPCRLLTTLSQYVKRACANSRTIRWRGNTCTGPISRRRNFWPRP
jgi:hypothetical protein